MFGNKYKKLVIREIEISSDQFEQMSIDDSIKTLTQIFCVLLHVRLMQEPELSSLIYVNDLIQVGEQSGIYQNPESREFKEAMLTHTVMLTQIYEDLDFFIEKTLTRNKYSHYRIIPKTNNTMILNYIGEEIPHGTQMQNLQLHLQPA